MKQKKRTFEHWMGPLTHSISQDDYIPILKYKLINKLYYIIDIMSLTSGIEDICV